MDTALRFGFSLNPTPNLAGHRELLRAAEAGGLDLVGIQDHPYSNGQLDTFALIAALMGETERLRFFSDVANLPLRHPSMLANAAASLDLISGGRFELGVGAGGYWSAIARMGVTEQLRRVEALDALEEGIKVMRALWRADRPVWFEGAHYSISGLRGGPGPAHDIGVWVGAQGPRALRLAGRLADGWAAPIPSYLPYEKWAAANVIIDQAARAAGRDPGEVLRIAQIVGTIIDEPGSGKAADDGAEAGAENAAGASGASGTGDKGGKADARKSAKKKAKKGKDAQEDAAAGAETAKETVRATIDARSGSGPVRATAAQWTDLLTRLATEQPFRAFILWPERTDVEQIKRFAGEVAPAVRERVSAATAAAATAPTATATQV